MLLGQSSFVSLTRKTKFKINNGYYLSTKCFPATIKIWLRISSKMLSNLTKEKLFRVNKVQVLKLPIEWTQKLRLPNYFKKQKVKRSRLRNYFVNQSSQKSNVLGLIQEKRNRSNAWNFNKWKLADILVVKAEVLIYRNLN